MRPLFYLPFLGILTNASDVKPNDPTKDFPNYFSDITMHFLSEGFSQVLGNYRYPYLVEDRLSVNGFFAFLKSFGDERNLKLYLGGGAVKSILGYLYELIRKVMLTEEEMIVNLIPKPLAFSDVLGACSDITIYVEFLNAEKAPLEKQNLDQQSGTQNLDQKPDPALERLKVMEELENVVNQARSELGTGDFINISIPQIRVKHKSDLEILKRGGGSSLKFLLFNLTKGSLEEFCEYLNLEKGNFKLVEPQFPYRDIG